MATDAEKKAAEEADAKPVKVKFEKSYSLYNKGEVATFPAAKADWLVTKKIAIKA